MENHQIEKIRRVREIILESQQIHDKLYNELREEFRLKKDETS